MYVIYFYAPSDHVEEVKAAMFAAGAGKVGAYKDCAWQVLGEGSFTPLSGSDAYIGKKNKPTRVPEYKVMMACHDEVIRDVVAALKKTHPYEEPAYQVLRCEDF